MTFFPEVSVKLSGERFRVVYHITGGSEDIEREALHLAHEQTVELSPVLVPPGDMQSVVGRVETLTYIRTDQYEVVISYPVEGVGAELPQLLNMIFGNTSLSGLVRVHQLNLPASFANRFPGPKFGVDGLRRIVKRGSGPLLATALKPLGYPTEQLVQYAFQFAAGGIDIIKDDHSLANQTFSTFRDRVRRCAKAVRVANERTGGNSLYAANVTGPVDQLIDRALYAVKAGAGAVEVVPGVVGLDAMRMLAEDARITVPIIGHPGWFGNLTVSARHGMTLGAIFGQFYRLAGADASIFTTFGGRFPTTQADCRHLVEMLNAPMGNIKPALPIPAGGLSTEYMPEVITFYGDDVALLVTDGLFKDGPDLIENCRTLRHAVEQAVVARLHT